MLMIDVVGIYLWSPYNNGGHELPESLMPYMYMQQHKAAGGSENKAIIVLGTSGFSTYPFTKLLFNLGK